MDPSGAKVMVSLIFSGAPYTSSGVKAIGSNDFRAWPRGPLGCKSDGFHMFSGAPDTSSGVKAMGSNDFRVDHWTPRVQK